MPTARSLLAALALTFAVGACDRDAPTSPAVGGDKQAPTAPKIARQPLVFPASQVLPASIIDGVVYTLTKVQVTKIVLNEDPATKATHKLAIDGFLQLTAPDGTTHTQAFINKPANLSSSGAPTAPTCQILDLDIGAIHLDLLGLVVDLAPVHLDIVAQSGPGNLLGNLLCGLVNLLNGLGTGDITALTQLLQQINLLLSQILAF
jgi:hypothetical protein